MNRRDILRVFGLGGTAFGMPKTSEAVAPDTGLGKFSRWKGEINRPLQMQRPCSCGCDLRGGRNCGVGYLTGSDNDGNGFTLWITDEALFQVLEKAARVTPDR